MLLTREEYLKRITRGLTAILVECHHRGALHLFDANTIAHEFFRRVLDLVYGLQLTVLDRIQENHPAIDLGDEAKRHSFQVTSDGSSLKVQNTLDGFARHKLYTKYDKVQMLVITGKQTTYTALQVPPDVMFSPEDDILDIRDLLKRIEALETPVLKDLASVVEEEIKSFIAEQPKRKKVIKTMFLASDPLGTSQREMAAEIASIVELARESELRRHLDFATWWIDRYQGMVQLICLEEPAIIHFLGSNATEFRLKDDQDRIAAVSQAQIKDLFGFLRDKVALVVIGAGFSQEQEQQICAEMPFVITTQLKGRDATGLSAVLYRGMAEGKSLQDAYDEAALSVGAARTQLHHSPDVKPADVRLGVDRDPPPSEESVRFVQLEIATKLCLWREMRHNCSPEAPPYHPISGRRWFNQTYDIGPKAWYPFGSHQIYNYFWPEEQKKADPRIPDPVIDFTILNGTGKPSVLSRIGIRPVNAWNAAKAAPMAFKLTEVDAYELRIARFDIGVDVLLTLDEPVYLEANAAYRVRLRLVDYADSVQKNESVIRLVVVVDNVSYVSDEIYLGIAQFLKDAEDPKSPASPSSNLGSD